MGLIKQGWESIAHQGFQVVVHKHGPLKVLTAKHDVNVTLVQRFAEHVLFSGLEDPNLAQLWIHGTIKI